MKTLDILHREMKKAHQNATWREIGFQYGITCGMAYRIATERYEPKTPKIRFQLGLPALIPVPACLKCGEVHMAKRCPRKPEAKHWRDWPDERIRWALENREELVRIRTMP